MKDTKPFNLDHAKAGAPYACRDGREATVLKWESRREGCPLLGVFDVRDLPGLWTGDGLNSGNRDLDLVMIPLGYIDGKPVFVDDEVEFAGNVVKVVPGDHGFQSCRWPAPAKQYPVTNCTPELVRKYNDVVTCNKHMGWHAHIAAIEGVANAALRHAVDNGQVISTEDHCDAMVRASVKTLEDVQAGRAMRDMAIAHAVLAAVKTVINAHSTCCLHALNGKINLNTIIAEVKA